MSDLLRRLDAPIQRCVYRGRILHCPNEDALEFISDGGLLVDEQGLIEGCGPWQQLEQTGQLQGAQVITLPWHQWIIPGFVDMHVHLPQIEVAGCQEENLLSWLERHIFQAEARFTDAAHAEAVSRWFFEELLHNGTTTAAVFLTSHDTATRIAFEVAEQLGNRVIMGQNLMDCHAPDALLKPMPQLLMETEAHCRQWHGKDQGRLQYAWIPRFAITSSEPLLEGLGQLRRQYPSVYLHTHLSEQLPEIEAVLRQFPWASDYTDVYEKFGLLGGRTILAHGIHLTDDELSRIGRLDSSLAHCPSSNFFLKSGRFRWMEMLNRGLRFGLGSDVGAGPELSLFKVMKDAQFMQSDTLLPLQQLFYRATLGGARALYLDDRIGNFEAGKEADFIILNERGKSNLKLPDAPVTDFPEESSPESALSQWVYLGDDRLVQATYIRGRQVYSQK
jgi:guanine deaminase